MTCADKNLSSPRQIRSHIKDLVAGWWYSRGDKKVRPVFVQGANASQNAVDLFEEGWVSSFPPDIEVAAGRLALYNDHRLDWWGTQSAVAGADVLELGPLEASHTWKLAQMGAKSITSVESNTRAFLKCLVAKEILDLRQARFYCADFVEFLSVDEHVYDICLASGVLYHMKDPLRLLELLCRRAKTVFLWTHYYDEQIARSRKGESHLFSSPREIAREGFQTLAFKRSYGFSAKRPSHLGGSAPYSLWLPKEGIIAALKHYGMDQVSIHEDQVDHPHGPALTLFARRSG